MTIINLCRWIRYNLRYLGKPPWDTGLVPPEVQEYIQTNLPGRALDLGAGSGTNMAALANAGWEVEGVDYACLAVLAARRKLRRHGFSARVYCRNVTRLDFLHGQFDLILDIGCFHGLSTKCKVVYIENLKSFLKVGATYLLYAFYSRTTGQVGITDGEIEHLSRIFSLRRRQAGVDKDGQASLWLEFKRME